VHLYDNNIGSCLHALKVLLRLLFQPSCSAVTPSSLQLSELHGKRDRHLASPRATKNATHPKPSPAQARTAADQQTPLAHLNWYSFTSNRHKRLQQALFPSENAGLSSQQQQPSGVPHSSYVQ